MNSDTAGVYDRYIDWCAACRTALYDKLDDKDKPALDMPFGRFLEEPFFISESRGGTSGDTPQRKTVNDLVVEADRVLEQYQSRSEGYFYATDEAIPPHKREAFQLSDGQVFDCSVWECKEWSAITRVRRQDGSRFYIHNSQGRGDGTNVLFYDVSVWVPGGSKMLVARSTNFQQWMESRAPGSPPYWVRYTRVEEAGISQMEGIAGILRKYFPTRRLPEEKAPAKKAVRRRWF